MAAASEGRKYTPPSPSEVQSSASTSSHMRNANGGGTPSRGLRSNGTSGSRSATKGNGGFRSSNTGGGSSSGGGGGLDSWGDWGTKKSSGGNARNNGTNGNGAQGGMWGVGSDTMNNNNNSNQYQMGGGGGDTGQKRQMWGVGSSHSISAADYEASQRSSNNQADDLTKAFNSGWNKLSEFASGVKQSDTTEKMMLQAQVGLVKGKEIGQKGWNSLLSFTKSAVSTIKDNINDITSDHQGGRGGGGDQRGFGDATYNSYQSTSNTNSNGNDNDFFGGFNNNGGSNSGFVQQSGQSYTEGFGSKPQMGGLKVSTMKKSSSFTGDARGSPRSPRSPRKSMGTRQQKAKVEDDNWGKW